jgi:hypothetical protein
LSGAFIFCYNVRVDDPLKTILNDLRDTADVELGPPDAVTPAPALLQSARLDNEILTLALSNMTYVEIARQLGIPLADVVRRVAGMAKGEPLGSAESMATYLRHQLELVQVGIESALKDMADSREGCGVEEIEIDKVASANRHQGRMALAKLLTHQAAILGLLRQRIDVTRRERVEIAVVRGEDYDAL